MKNGGEKESRSLKSILKRRNFMKKLLSVFLTAAMLLTLVVALAAPASAVDGAWWVYCSKGYYREDFEGDEPSIVGYEYTAEGLRVIPADWRDHKPAAGLQTKDKVDLKDGVYMLIRIDEFTFANDKWFNMNIWDAVMVSPVAPTLRETARAFRTSSDLTMQAT